MNKIALKTSILLSVFTLPIVLAANKKPANTSTYKPKIELTGKLGYSSKKSAKRNIARLGFVLPLFQKTGRYMTFLSVIGMKDSAKHVEGNLGVGHRVFINSRWILGGYGFYDARKTENNNLIHQITIGIEALSKNLEYRGNIYVPFGKSHDLGLRNIYDINYRQQRHTTTFKNSSQHLTEIGLYGFDIEAGGSLPRYSRFEGFLAFYYFNEKNVKAVTGIRIRANFILTRWFSIEGESNLDKQIGHTSYLGMKLSWNFNSRKNRKFQTSINRKMTQLPVRDIDAVTAVREDSPITIFEETRRGLVAAILPKGALTDGSIIKANVPVDIGYVSNINKSTSSISDIAIFSKDGEIIRYVGSDDPAKQATPKELTDNKISDINISVIDKKTTAEFRKNIAKDKISKGQMTHEGSVISRLVTPKEAIQDSNLTETKAIESGLKAGLTKDQLVTTNGLSNAVVKQVAKSGVIPPRNAIDQNILTEQEAIEAGLKNGLTKNQLVNNNGLSNDVVTQAAKSGVIPPRNAIDQNILTEQEAVVAGINNGLTREQLVNDNGLGITVIKAAVASGQHSSLKQAKDNNILTASETIDVGLSKGYSLDNVQALTGVSNKDVTSWKKDKTDSYQALGLPLPTNPGVRAFEAFNWSTYHLKLSLHQAGFWSSKKMKTLHEKRLAKLLTNDKSLRKYDSKIQTRIKSHQGLDPAFTDSILKEKFHKNSDVHVMNNYKTYESDSTIIANTLKLRVQSSGSKRYIVGNYGKPKHATVLFVDKLTKKAVFINSDYNAYPANSLDLQHISAVKKALPTFDVISDYNPSPQCASWSCWAHTIANAEGLVNGHIDLSTKPTYRRNVEELAREYLYILHKHHQDHYLGNPIL